MDAKHLRVETSLIDFDSMLDKFLAREQKPKSVGRYYPSEVGACLRKTWFSYKFPQEVDFEKRRIFETGHILHEYVVRVLKSEKTTDVKLLNAELPFQLKIDDFIVSGRVDDLLLVKASGETVVVEVKSTSWLPKAASPHHVMQLQFYLHALGVRNGALLYIEKNKLATKVFPIPFDEKIALEGIARFKELDKALKADKAPEPEAKLKPEMNWWCNYCEYKEKCDATG